MPMPLWIIFNFSIEFKINFIMNIILTLKTIFTIILVQLTASSTKFYNLEFVSFSADHQSFPDITLSFLTVISNFLVFILIINF